MKLPASWQPIIGDELSKPYFHQLQDFLRTERVVHEVYPPEAQVFSALQHTPWPDAKVIILGQDPYHNIGQAHGLAFSVAPDVKKPPSLVNIFKELQADLGILPSASGCLHFWADQGVVLLNTVLTVRAHAAHSHRNKGWETFTDTIIGKINARQEPAIFLLWGAPAQKKQQLIGNSKHVVLTAAHPSPLSAHQGFFGSRPFSKINRTLVSWGQREIDWRIAD